MPVSLFVFVFLNLRKPVSLFSLFHFLPKGSARGYTRTCVQMLALRMKTHSNALYKSDKMLRYLLRCLILDIKHISAVEKCCTVLVNFCCSCHLIFISIWAWTALTGDNYTFLSPFLHLLPLSLEWDLIISFSPPTAFISSHLSFSSSLHVSEASSKFELVNEAFCHGHPQGASG